MGAGCRVQALGGKIAQSAHDDGTPMGPLRVWPGGLAISRTIGDRAAAEGGVMAEPEVSQVVVPEDVGVRLIAASDGLWDGLTIKVGNINQPRSLNAAFLVESGSPVCEDGDKTVLLCPR